MAISNGNSNSTPRAAADEKSVHVVIFPIPILGRTNPMLQFAKRLASKGLKVTLATTSSFASKLLDSSQLSQSSPSLSVASVSDKPHPPTLNELIEQFEVESAPGIVKLIEEQSTRGTPVRCLVYDSSFPWALGFARSVGIYAVPFFPQPFAVSLIFFHVYRGVLDAPVKEGEDGRVSAPGLPLMDIRDMPTLVREIGKHPLAEKLVLNQFSNFSEADWQFFNTFDVLEAEVMNWMSKQWPNIRAIGPGMPSMYLDKRIENDTEYGISPFNPETATCIGWLDTQEPSSTIYVSFGSLAALEGSQMEEMAAALKNTKKPFLWVVKAMEEDTLPPGFKDEVSGQGMIVSWCPQLAVLNHESVGCFFTHCGWNSTTESICAGVPLVAMPLWADQPTNAKFVEDVWKVGVRVREDENGFVKREEIERCIGEVMDGEKGNEVRLNASKWKMVSIEAMQEGGSSDKNIDEFIARIS